MKFIILFVFISFSYAFPAPSQTSLRQSRSTDLIRNFEQFDPATTAVSFVKTSILVDRILFSLFLMLINRRLYSDFL